MDDTPIVQATVVETPKPERPDKWIVLGPEDGYLTLAEAESFVREMLSDGYYESFIAHIPGTHAAGTDDYSQTPHAVVRHVLEMNEYYAKWARGVSEQNKEYCRLIGAKDAALARKRSALRDLQRAHNELKSGTRAAAAGDAHLCADCKTEPHLFGGLYCRSCERKREEDKVDAADEVCKHYSGRIEYSKRLNVYVCAAWNPHGGIVYGRGPDPQSAARAALEAIRAKGEV